jgi:phosphatidyl-myo-inositol dimannoside synthase
LLKSLLLTGVFPPKTGGSGRWLWDIYRQLPREKVVIVAGDHAEAAPFESTHDLNVYRLPFFFPDYGTISVNGFNRYRRVTRRVLRIAVKERVATIHCGALLPDGWIGQLVAKKLELPLLVYLHGEELCYTASSRQLNWMARRVLRYASTVVVNSHNTRRIARDHWGVSEEKLRVLHPGVDCERFTPVERSAEVRQRLGWGERPVILTVGRLQKRKGQDLLIRALSAIRGRVPDVLYAIVGEGDERANLERLAEQLGLNSHVRFHGEPPDADLPECYQQCDLFVLPNRRIGDDLEGFGIVLLEAQACGKPVIAGDTGGTVETMQVGQTGNVADVERGDLLADSICALLRQPRLRLSMGIAARKWVLDNFAGNSTTDLASLLSCSTPVERVGSTK